MEIDRANVPKEIMNTGPLVDWWKEKMNMGFQVPELEIEEASPPDSVASVLSDTREAIVRRIESGRPWSIGSVHGIVRQSIAREPAGMVDPKVDAILSRWGVETLMIADPSRVCAIALTRQALVGGAPGFTPEVNLTEAEQQVTEAQQAYEALLSKNKEIWADIESQDRELRAKKPTAERLRALLEKLVGAAFPGRSLNFAAIQTEIARAEQGAGAKTLLAHSNIMTTHNELAIAEEEIRSLTAAIERNESFFNNLEYDDRSAYGNQLRAEGLVLEARTWTQDFLEPIAQSSFMTGLAIKAMKNAAKLKRGKISLN